MTKAELQKQAVAARRQYRANVRLTIGAFIGLPILALVAATVTVALWNTHRGILVVIGAIALINVVRYFKKG
jgi:hypothetical protein